MVYEIPNNDSQQDAALSRISSAVIADLGMRSSGTGRAPGWGMEIVSAGANRAASTGVGFYYIQDQLYVAPSVSFELSANTDPSGYDRVDIVEIDRDGVYSVIEGTAGSIAYEPDRSMEADGIRPSKCKLAAILVKNGDSTIPDEQILQRTFEVYPTKKIIPVNGMPGRTIGVAGDLAVNTITNEIWKKETAASWEALPLKYGGNVALINRQHTSNAGIGPNQGYVRWTLRRMR